MDAMVHVDRNHDTTVPRRRVGAGRKLRTQTRFGEQPARQIIREQGKTVKGVAEDIHLSYAQVRDATVGRTPPSVELRRKLSHTLGVPVEELFTAEILRAHKYGPRTFAPARDA